jgi:broad specificity phosphatase PhoE
VTELLFVRHGETDWNDERRLQGHADTPLNDRGRRQAEELAAHLAHQRVDALYTSDLRRASETAAVIAARLGLEPVADPGLREVDVGEWSGLTRPEIAERWPEAVRWSDGETPEEMAGRVLAAARRIAAAHRGGRVVVVTHGGPIRALRAAASGMSYEDHRRLEPAPAANCAVHGFACESGDFRPLD